jgi:hypothetical protein
MEDFAPPFSPFDTLVVLVLPVLGLTAFLFFLAMMNQSINQSIDMLAGNAEETVDDKDIMNCRPAIQLKE